MDEAKKEKKEMTGNEKKKEQDPTEFRFIDRNTTAFLINMRRKELICKKLMPPTLSRDCLTSPNI